ncbi:MAG TPA: 30S ribosomal protein S6 [Chloroflexota bacterium]|nr:30S ribosomal protein S6 [Chloroflexota bacterium]
MRDYELTLILKPTLNEEGIAGTTSKVEGWITGNGGEMVTVTPVGRKRLAYPVAHQRDGSYVVMQLRARPETLVEVERNLKLSEDVLRHMILRR